MKATIHRQAVLKIIVGVMSVCAGYIGAGLHRTAESKSPIMLGEFNSPNPKLSIWLDFGQFAGESTHAQLRDIATRIGLKLDVDWENIPNDPAVANSTPKSGCYATVQEYLEDLFPQDVGLFNRHPWRVQAGTLIVRDPMPAADAGAIVRVYDISPTLDRLRIDDPWPRYGMWYRGGSFVPYTTDTTRPMNNENVSEDLDRLIERHIEPDIWGAEVLAPDRSWIKTLPGFLIVRATPDVQARIVRFIRLLNGDQ